MAMLAGFLGHLALEGVAPRDWYERGGGLSLAAAALLLAEGLLLMLLQRRLGREARTAGAAAALEPALGGWWVSVLAIHAVAAGWSFVAAGPMGGGVLMQGMAEVLTPSHRVLIGASRALAVSC